MATDGLCLVVSPLVALMQDQVKQLHEKNIRATMVVSGMSMRQIDHAYGNCIHGDYKFLYVSPERLKNETFLTRFAEMPVRYIAVDEAHCISQWGYDFRPTYQEIHQLRDIQHVPILALTATATKPVVVDIQEKLELQNTAVFQSGISRTNLSFQVREVADKFPKLIEILQFIGGSCIVYTMSRKSTQLIAKELESQGFSATSYHAGLDHRTRKLRQEEWIQGNIRIMVATNAFGMGIDKNDVRSVIHYHVPESIEAYYQEAGRAGRDGKNSVAVLLYNQQDKERLNESAENRFPDVGVVKQMLIGLFQHLKITYGDGTARPYRFQIREFATQFAHPVQLAYNAIQTLVRQGWISLSDPFYAPSRFTFKISNRELYRFQVNSPEYEPLIKYLLRNFTGIFEQTVKIDEEQIGKYLSQSKEKVIQQLNYFNVSGIGAFYEQSEHPLLSFFYERPNHDEITLNKDQLNFLRERHQEKIAAMVNYYNADGEACRTELMQNYFGEQSEFRCGICDLCLSRKNTFIADQIEQKAMEILALLAQQPSSTQQIWATVKGKNALLELAMQHLRQEERIVKNNELWQKRLSAR